MFYIKLGLFGFDWVCFHQVSNPVFFSYLLILNDFTFNLPAGKLALFFQIGLEFSSVQGFHICHSRGSGNPHAVRSTQNTER